MSLEVLNKVVLVRKKLINPIYQEGEISGYLELDSSILLLLNDLVSENIIDSTVIVENKSTTINKIILSKNITRIQVVLYINNIKNAHYYENISNLISTNYNRLPESPFYIYQEDYFSIDSIEPINIQNFKNILTLIEILSSIYDYKQLIDGEYFELVFFEKKKISLYTKFTSNQLIQIENLNKLQEHFTSAHDKTERIEIFKSELVRFLYGYMPEMRFGTLVLSFDQLFANYEKSHHLYLEKFSYYEIKAQVDNEKLDFIKKIAAAVNDIQSKIIAVPAAYLLISTLFDFDKGFTIKNNLILFSSLLFAILLEILLTSQFDVLKFSETQIKQTSEQLKEKQTGNYLEEFISSLSDLFPSINRQRKFLWIFRLIVWSVPITFIFCAFLKSKA